MLALQLLSGALILGSVYALFSVSLNLVWGISSIVNIAQGSIFILGAYTLLVARQHGIPIYVTCLGVILVGGALFYFIYVGLYKRLGQRNIEYSSLLLTWGASLVIEYVLRTTVGTDLQSITVFTGVEHLWGTRIPRSGIAIFITGMIFAGGLAVFLRWIRMGRAMRAVGARPDLASSVGIDVTATRALAFALGMVMAVISGMLFGMLYVFYPGLGDNFILKAVAVCLVAGLARLWRSWLIGMILGIVETFVQYEWGVTWSQMVAYGLLVLGLLFYSDSIRRHGSILLSRLRPSSAALQRS